MAKTMNLSASFDFEDEKFQAPPSDVLPWCQMINPRLSKTGLKPYGLAISLEKAKGAGFTPDENWQEVEYEFGNGEINELYITTTPRLLVIRRGPVGLKARDTGMTIGRLGDHYDAFMADKLKFKTFTRHLIFLVGKNKKLLHKSPLRLTLSGAAGASFGIAYRHSKYGETATGFTAELEKAYADYTKQPLSAKGALFHAHGIFCPIIEPQEKGTGSNTALVATTVDYEHPKTNTLPDYLIPSNSEESATICQTYEDYKDFGQELPKVETLATEKGEISGIYSYPDEFDYGEPPY